MSLPEPAGSPPCTAGEVLPFKHSLTEQPVLPRVWTGVGSTRNLLQQGGKDSSQPAPALYTTCCFCLLVFSKCSLLKPLSYCGGFHLKYMFRLVTSSLSAKKNQPKLAVSRCRPGSVAGHNMYSSVSSATVNSSFLLSPTPCQEAGARQGLVSAPNEQAIGHEKTASSCARGASDQGRFFH